MQQTGGVQIAGRQIAGIAFAPHGVRCPHRCHETLCNGGLCGFDGHRKFRDLGTHVSHQMRLRHRVIVVTGKAHAMLGTHLRHVPDIGHQDFLRPRPYGDGICHHLARLGFRNAVMRGLVLDVHLEVPVLPLPRRMIHERHQIDLSIVQQLPQHTHRIVEGDVKPRMDAMIDTTGAAHGVQVADHLACMGIRPPFAIARAA